MKQLANRIRSCLKVGGGPYTQQELAARAGVSQSWISKVLRGNIVDPRSSMVSKLDAIIADSNIPTGTETRQ